MQNRAYDHARGYGKVARQTVEGEGLGFIELVGERMAA
jgi:hypothetical protein